MSVRKAVHSLRAVVGDVFQWTVYVTCVVTLDKWFYAFALQRGSWCRNGCQQGENLQGEGLMYKITPYTHFIVIVETYLYPDGDHYPCVWAYTLFLLAGFSGSVPSTPLGFVVQPNVRVPAHFEITSVNASQNSPAEDDISAFIFRIQHGGDTFYLLQVFSIGKKRIQFIHIHPSIVWHWMRGWYCCFLLAV